MRIGENDFRMSGLVTLDSTGDKYTFRPAVPVRLVRFGYIVGVELDNTAALVLELDTVGVAASAPVRSSSRGSVTGSGTEVIGAVRAHRFETAPDVDKTSFQVDTNLDVNVLVPGHEAVFQVATAATAGDGYLFIEYTPLSFQIALGSLATGNIHIPIERTS